MRSISFAIAAAATAGVLAQTPISTRTHVPSRVDTVFVAARIDYDELARRVSAKLASNPDATVIEGDLIVKGRLGVGGSPEAGTPYAVTIRGQNDASIRFISNEALKDPQRVGTQHNHVGSLGLGQDGGLRLDQNSTCYIGNRPCEVNDRRRRRAYSGFDSVGDMSFYISDVDSLTGRETAPSAQSLVFRLLDWDGNIHLHSHRPGQRIYFNSSTTLHAADLQWEVPLR